MPLSSYLRRLGVQTPDWRRQAEEALIGPHDALEEPFSRDERGNVVALPNITTPEVRLPGPARPPDLGAPPVRQPSRYEQINEARDVYAKGAPGRLKSGLLNALRGGLQGLASGGGLGGALGGAAAGGLIGSVSPKTAREMEFEQTIRPRIEERFGFEDYDRAQQQQAEDRGLNQRLKQAQLANVESETEARRLPRPVRGPQPAMKLGTNRRTGRLGWYDAADEAKASEFEPFIEERKFAPDWVETPQGFVNLNAPGVDPRKVRRLQRPRGSGGATTSRREERDSQRQMSQAANGVNASAKLFREAMAAPESERPGIFAEMRALAENLEAQFPGLVEVYEDNGWPGVRLRKREAKATAQRTASKSDPLGIR